MVQLTDADKEDADVIRLIRAGLNPEAAVTIIRRLRGRASEKELLRALGFR